MLEQNKTFQPKPNTVDELKKVLKTILDDLPQISINKAVLSFIKRLRACVKAGVDTLNTSSNKLFSQGFELLTSCDRIKQLQEFLKSDNWLWRYCILSGGVFYFEPPCISTHLTFQVSQGSAATDLRWGENFNKFLFRISLLNIAVKNIMKICQYLRELSKKIKVSRFLWTTV